MELSQNSDSSFLTASPVLPGQLEGGARIDAAVSADLALRLAVLDDAIRCLALGHQIRGTHDQRLAREAEAWIRNLDRRWPFSFSNICEALGINGLQLRRKLLELRYPATLPRTARA